MSIDQIHLKLSRRCAWQVARILRGMVSETRLRAARILEPGAAEEMLEVIAVADDLERQLATRTVVLKVIEVGPLDDARPP